MLTWPARTGIEVVITGLTRNQFVGNSGTWVRIPPCPPNAQKPPYLRRFCFILHDFYTILFKISTARSSSLGYRWEYVFHVILTSVWSKRRAISCIFMPSFANSEACYAGNYESLWFLVLLIWQAVRSFLLSWYLWADVFPRKSWNCRWILCTQTSVFYALLRF